MTPITNRLASLNGQPLGPYTLRVADVRAGGRSGWASFQLLLASSEAAFEPAVLEGIFSAGSRGVMPWVEITEYRPHLKARQGDLRDLDLAHEGLDLLLFCYLSELIPRGGHLMVACESPQHEPTYRLLMRRVPPVLTPLGRLLFDCGFRSVRFFYWAEGGWEGQQKLWAEKALNPDTRKRWDETTARELLQFLVQAENSSLAPECAQPALGILRQVQPPGALGQLLQSVLEECRSPEAQDPEAFFECVRGVLARSRATWGSPGREWAAGKP